MRDTKNKKRKISGVELADKMKKGITMKFLRDLKELKKSRSRQAS